MFSITEHGKVLVRVTLRSNVSKTDCISKGCDTEWLRTITNAYFNV